MNTVPTGSGSGSGSATLTETAANLLKYQPFFIPHTISSVCFGCFDTGPKH
jgi:hypothetical protein